MNLNVANFTTKIRHNLLSFLAPGGSPGLQKHQIYGVIFASAEACSDVYFLDVIGSSICEYGVDDGEIMSLAKSAVAFVRSEETNKDSLKIE
jgi:hypothetical protein